MATSSSDNSSFEEVKLSTSELFKLVPIFDGEEPRLNSFIQACNATTNIASGFQKPLLFIHIKNQLRGLASQIINTREIVDWEECKECLMNHFADSRDTVSLIHDLQSFNQKFSESALQFCSRISAQNAKTRSKVLLSRDLISEEKAAQVDLCDKISLPTVLTGLNKEIGVIIRARNPKDLAECVHLIQAEEQLIYLENARKKHNQSNNFSTRNFVNQRTNNKKQSKTKL